MTEKTTSEYPRIASILALVGGVIITLTGTLFLAVSAFVLPSLNYTNLTVPSHLPATALPGLVAGFVGLLGAFGLVTGAIVLVSSVMLLARAGQTRTWGILILVFSLLSFLGMGGFILGAVLGVVGGALVIKWRPQSAQA